VKLLVAAREALVDHNEARPASAVLLEGSWPKGGRSLDDAIDARFHWIDQAAVYWAECLDELAPADHLSSELPASAAWLNALPLRYYLVKLLRVVAYFTEVQPLAATDEVELLAQWGRDKDYADLIGQLCEHAGAALHVKWSDQPVAPGAAFPVNSRWRRALARLGQWLEPAATGGSSRVVLCGNPRLLDPVAEELHRRNARLWWLYDRFALGSWLRWRARGVGQLICDSSQGQENRLLVPGIERVEYQGVDLAGPLRRWFAERLATSGARQTRILEQIDASFRRLRPDALVVDEDATPFARAAVAVARQHGATSFVVQHGAPCCQFGFAPLAADRILAWGQSSADQLVRWAVPEERIDVVGSPQHERLYQTFVGRKGLSQSESGRHAPALKATSSKRKPRILLLATVPPRDERPDAAWLHMTRRAYADMIRAAVTTIAEIPRARLIVKLHPRAPHDPILEQALADHRWLKARLVRKASLERCLCDVDCVVSCGSSAGIDATLAGLPVVQLLPAGSGEVLPHDQWGLAGTARSAAELKVLVGQVLSGVCPPAADPRVFGDLSGSAERIAEAVLTAQRRPSPETPVTAPRGTGLLHPGLMHDAEPRESNA
jgi:hypothetical protein